MRGSINEHGKRRSTRVAKLRKLFEDTDDSDEEYNPLQRRNRQTPNKNPSANNPQSPLHSKGKGGPSKRTSKRYEEDSDFESPTRKAPVVAYKLQDDSDSDDDDQDDEKDDGSSIKYEDSDYQKLLIIKGKKNKEKRDVRKGCKNTKRKRIKSSSESEDAKVDNSDDNNNSSEENNEEGSDDYSNSSQSDSNSDRDRKIKHIRPVNGNRLPVGIKRKKEEESEVEFDDDELEEESDIEEEEESDEKPKRARAKAPVRNLRKKRNASDDDLDYEEDRDFINDDDVSSSMTSSVSEDDDDDDYEEGPRRKKKKKLSKREKKRLEQQKKLERKKMQKEIAEKLKAKQRARRQKAVARRRAKAAEKKRKIRSNQVNGIPMPNPGTSNGMTVEQKDVTVGGKIIGKKLVMRPQAQDVFDGGPIIEDAPNADLLSDLYMNIESEEDEIGKRGRVRKKVRYNEDDSDELDFPSVSSRGRVRKASCRMKDFV